MALTEPVYLCAAILDIWVNKKEINEATLTPNDLSNQGALIELFPKEAQGFEVELFINPEIEIIYLPLLD